MNTENDYYKILELSSSSSQSEIKEQYILLAHAWHPDKFNRPSHKQKATEKLKAINIAYETLGDINKRAEYDQFRLSASSQYRDQSGHKSHKKPQHLQHCSACRKIIEAEWIICPFCGKQTRSANKNSNPQKTSKSKNYNNDGNSQKPSKSFNCPQCQSLVPHNKKACPNCGKEFFNCPTCRKPVTYDQRICLNCGERLMV